MKLEQFSPRMSSIDLIRLYSWNVREISKIICFIRYPSFPPPSPVLKIKHEDPDCVKICKNYCASFELIANRRNLSLCSIDDDIKVVGRLTHATVHAHHASHHHAGIAHAREPWNALAGVGGGCGYCRYFELCCCDRCEGGGGWFFCENKFEFQTKSDLMVAA